MSSLLVLGGARSGKSRYAESRASGACFYLATAQAFDDEMRQRIALHRERRGSGWTTLEASLHLATALRQADGAGHFVLIDCLTLWLSNLMHAGHNVPEAVSELCQVIGEAKGFVAVVSNEVGQGIVPENALARAFRDEQGWCNQRVAAQVDEVVLVVAGLPLTVKPAAR
jgi:adenosylcobinamide kinase/adenosylcobinamide-phosphate guanylyltransferase